MRILAIGDVVGNIGVEALRRHMPAIKKRYSPDIIIVNGENAGDNSSITAKNCDALFAMGADVITGGNHSLYNRDMNEIYDRGYGALRPANLHPNAPGSGVYVYEKGKFRCAVISLIGNVFLDLAYESPFIAAEKIIKELGIKHVVIDMHGEATSEKIALGRYVEGKASLVFGTHTHVPTSDTQVLPKGTGYVTDLGMTGPKHSVLGIQPKLSIAKFRGDLTSRYQWAEGPTKLEAVLFTIDSQTGLCRRVERVDLYD